MVAVALMKLKELDGALRTRSGGIDENYSLGQALGMNTGTFVGFVILASVVVCLFFIVVYPLVERARSVKAARA